MVPALKHEMKKRLFYRMLGGSGNNLTLHIVIGCLIKGDGFWCLRCRLEGGSKGVLSGERNLIQDSHDSQFV